MGASATPSFPVTLLQTAVADAISDLTVQLKQKLESKVSLDLAIYQVVREVIKETKAIRFEGNNYSPEWVKEAEKRNIPNLRKTPEALAQMVQPETKKLFARTQVLSEAELVSRYHVKVERYLKDLQIELDVLKVLVDSHVIPVAFQFLDSLASGISSLGEAGITNPPQQAVLKSVCATVTELQKKRAQLSAFEKTLSSTQEMEDKATLFAEEGCPIFQQIREHCDQLEGQIDDRLWPLPKYQEMLFIS